MKIEMGESLIYSFLRHEKKCLITQTNWKPSSTWGVSPETQDLAIFKFNKINKHHAFSQIFQSTLSQTLRQAEIDVLGIGQDNHIYAFEVAFHENGLQYGGKIETRNRIFKKLLRSYIALEYYFPHYEHTIAFCSPKVNPATEIHIKDYFEVLQQDFQTKNTTFHYYANENFTAEIAQKIFTKIINESDNSELFARAIKLFNLTNKLPAPQPAPTPQPVQQNQISASTSVAPNKTINTHGNPIPFTRNGNESVQNFVRRVMRLLLEKNLLSQQEIQKLQDQEYSKSTFFLQLPLLRKESEGYKDRTGRARYWVNTIGGFYICSQWWKDHEKIYWEKLYDWLASLKLPINGEP